MCTARAQRSDPKSGDPADWPTGHGPQDDAIRINNYAGCVTGGVSSEIVTGGEADPAITSGAAQPSGENGQPGGQGGPLQEAIDACSGLSDGSDCSMNTPQGTLSGTCTSIQSQLACVPEGRPGGQP